MQKFIRSAGLALRNLMLHKLRSLLTVLGLIFGVSSVIAMLAIAEGASAEAQRQIAELGATNIILHSTKPLDDDDDVPKSQSNDSFVIVYGLTHKDYHRIRDTIPTVIEATPLREYRKPVRHLDREVEARIVGVNPDYPRLINQTVADGRFIADLDLARFSNVAVIGTEISERLFPFGDPIGKAIRIGDRHFYEVIGVTSRKSASAGTGSSLAAQDFNKDVYIPLTTDRARFGDVLIDEKQGSMTAEKIELSQITVAVDKIENVKRTSEAIESLLKQTHPRQDYAVTVPLELLEKAEATKRIFNIVLGSIAGISLIVGGIGIMNIMLATVTERTREIGIRRALGARRRDITLQFLIETAVMSSTGGLIGVVLGLLVPPFVSRASGIPVVIEPWAPIVAFLISVSIGVIFGVYPAQRAARMDPVDALRTE